MGNGVLLNISVEEHEVFSGAGSRGWTRHAWRLLVAAIVFFLSVSPALSSGRQADDRFIAGYAAAILDRELHVAVDSLRVEDGVVTVRIGDYGEADRATVRAVLSQIEGVERIDILEEPALLATSEPGKDEAEDEQGGSGVLFPKERLFKSLMAAPRWPHFSLAYHYYIDDDELTSVGATSFGETFYFYKDKAPFDGEWQIGIQASVFAIFDLDSDSMDLINADYWVGFPLSYRRDDFAALLRVFHQSSHLGDEFLLRSRIDRVNLSYESIDTKFSYDFSEQFRLYGGAGFIFHKEPSDIDPWSLQGGIELQSPVTFFDGVVRPVAGADFSTWEENDWEIDVSLKTGVQLESERIGRRIQFLLEYFSGHSPSGQFYNRTIEYLGFGTHFYF